MPPNGPPEIHPNGDGVPVNPYIPRTAFTSREAARTRVRRLHNKYMKIKRVLRFKVER